MFLLGGLVAKEDKIIRQKHKYDCKIPIKPNREMKLRKKHGTKSCPYCKREILKIAIRCKYCKTMLK